MSLSTGEGTTARAEPVAAVEDVVAAAVVETVRSMLRRQDVTYEMVAVAAGDTARRLVVENLP